MSTDPMGNPIDPDDFLREVYEAAYRFAVRRGFDGAPDEIADAVGDALRARARDALMASSGRRHRLGACRRLPEVFGSATRLAFAFDDPSEDLLVPEDLADEAIEQLYGMRSRGRRELGNRRFDRPW